MARLSHTQLHRWIALAAAVLGLLATISLGNWQMRRAANKEHLQQQMLAAVRAPAQVVNARDAATLLIPPYQHVRISGVWLPEQVVYLDNRPHDGKPGLYVLMPLLLNHSEHVVMVNRGWLAHDRLHREKIGAYHTPQGTVVIDGVTLNNEPKFLELGGVSSRQLKGIWQNFDFQRFAEVSRLTLLPVIVRQDNAPLNSDGLIRAWPEASSVLSEQIQRHYGYAFQWYGLAVLIVVLTIIYGRSKSNKINQ